MGLEDILQWLAVGKKTGILELKASCTPSGCFPGWPDHQRVVLGSARVSGPVPAAFNRITRSSCASLATQEDENQLLGRILVNRQLVTEVEIRRIVQLKVEESVSTPSCGPRAASSSTTAPRPAEVHAAEPGRHRDRPGGRPPVDEWKRIRSVVKGGDAVLAAVPEAIADMLPLAPEDADLLSRLDGFKSIDQLVIEMRVPEFKANKLLFDLHEKGMVRILHPGGKLASIPACSCSGPGSWWSGRSSRRPRRNCGTCCRSSPGSRRPAGCCRWWSTCCRKTRRRAAGAGAGGDHRGSDAGAAGPTRPSWPPGQRGVEHPRHHLHLAVPQRSAWPSSPSCSNVDSQVQQPPGGLQPEFGR